MKTTLDKLSKAESEIFLRLFSGKNNASIARDLNISENTVKFHLVRIYHKTGSESRADLMARFSNPNTADEEAHRLIRELREEMVALKNQMHELQLKMKDVLPVPYHGNKIR
ncbi:MAG: helix-turn-helix transcriptional regulator [Pseudobdellovibrionaceae bacterium]